MVGLFQRLKAWFSRLISGEPEVKPVEIPEAAKTEVEVLMEEHQQLEAERKRLRDEIALLDERYRNGEITPAQRDREYRVRLARAGAIGLRQREIRARLAALGHPIPREGMRSHAM